MRSTIIRTGAIALVLLCAGCSRQRSPTAVPELGSKWKRIITTKCEPTELGKDAVRLFSAINESIGPLEAKRRTSRRPHGTGPAFRLLEITYFRAVIAGEPIVLGVGDFNDRYATYHYEEGLQTRVILWRGQISVLEVAEQTSGLLPKDPLELWGFGKAVRILLKDYNSHGCYATSDGFTVWDYDLGDGKFTRQVGVGDSEHYYEFTAKMEIDIAGGQMVITVTDPKDGKDPEAEVGAESTNPGVKIEQLRRTCVRVTLPNPS